MQEIAEALRKVVAEGREAVVGRVVDVQGFSTLSADSIVGVDADGTLYGQLLGGPGAEQLRAGAAGLLGGGSGRDQLATVSIVIRESEVADIGLACGGQADVLLQPVAGVPPVLWDLLAERAPAALLTRVGGPAAGPAAVVVDRTGTTWGRFEGSDGLVADAVSLLAAGRTATRRLEDPAGEVLLEAWVPEPRLVVVGTGELVPALDAQGRLLGWESRATDDPAEVSDLLDWAGATAALIVLSHNPHVDTPALVTGLARGVPYVGALGSRSTQSRRVERLTKAGIGAADIERIHRPIGLDLGGRRASEVALAIAAEILACHCGRDARPLRDATGPINDRPARAVTGG